MGFLDWIEQRKQKAQLKAFASKYGHDSIGSRGSATRHFQKIKSPDSEKPNTVPRPEILGNQHAKCRLDHLMAGRQKETGRVAQSASPGNAASEKTAPKKALPKRESAKGHDVPI